MEQNSSWHFGRGITLKDTSRFALLQRKENPMNKQYLFVRDIETREIVHTVEVTGRSENMVEKVMRGMLINMNTDKFFIDDSKAYKKGESDE